VKKKVRVSLSPVAENEVIAGYNMTNSKGVAEDPRDKILRTQGGKGTVEMENKEAIDAETFDAMGFGSKRGQTKWRVIGIEKKAGMGLKRHHCMGYAEVMGDTAGGTDHMQMPVMHAIKIPQGDDTLARLRRQVRKVTKNTHKPGLLLVPGQTAFLALASRSDGLFGLRQECESL